MLFRSMENGLNISEDWIRVKSKHNPNRFYFYNVKTKVSQWELHTNLTSHSAQVKKSSLNLNSAKVECKSLKRKYTENCHTKSSANSEQLNILPQCSSNCSSDLIFKKKCKDNSGIKAVFDSICIIKDTKNCPTKSSVKSEHLNITHSYSSNYCSDLTFKKKCKDDSGVKTTFNNIRVIEKSKTKKTKRKSKTSIKFSPYSVSKSSSQVNPNESSVDVEKKSQSVPENKSIQNPIFIILDTNIFLHNLHLINEMLTFENELVLYLPWIVVNELDKIKDKSSFKDDLKKSSIKAIRFIRTCLLKKISKFKTQSPEDDSQPYENLVINCSDDRIVKCALQLRRKNPKHRIIVLSNDCNLLNKVMIFEKNILTYSSKEIMTKLSLLVENSNQVTQFTQTCPQTSSHLELECLSKRQRKQLLRVKRQNKNSLKSQLTSESELIKNETIIKSLICDVLSVILQKEMEEIYGDLWKKIVKCQPPWTLDDVMWCIQSHWIAVFSSFQSKSVENKIICMKTSLKNAFTSKFNQNLFIQTTIEFLESFQKLIYKDKVGECIKHLKDFQEIQYKPKISTNKSLPLHENKDGMEVCFQSYTSTVEILHPEVNSDIEICENSVLNFFTIHWKAINCYCGTLARCLGVSYEHQYDDLGCSISDLLTLLPQFLSKLQEINKLYESLLSFADFSEKEAELHIFLNSLLSFFPLFNINSQNPIPYVDSIMLCRVWNIDKNKIIFFNGYKQLQMFIQFLENIIVLINR